MRRQILLSPQELNAAIKSNACIVFDCRFDLSDTASGYRDYLEAHIPGAIYAHLDDDLSSPVTANSGRHPLPDADKFAAFLARSGWQPGISLIAYDNMGGAIAARLWWLMKYFGYDCAALLDGGITSWQPAGFELESGRVTATGKTPVSFNSSSEMVVDTAVRKPLICAINPGVLDTKTSTDTQSPGFLTSATTESIDLDPLWRYDFRIALPYRQAGHAGMSQFANLLGSAPLLAIA